MILLVLAVLTTIAAYFTIRSGSHFQDLPSRTLIWWVTSLALTPVITKAQEVLRLPFRWLRARPALYWLLLLILTFVLVSRFIHVQQPVWGRPLDAYALTDFFASAWLWWLLASFGAANGDGRRMTAQLGKSRFTGLLITLTTLVIIVIGVEMWMRTALIISDGFAFTAMHRHWNALHWNPINSLGYRDFEPNNDPTLQHILVVGDSFVSGHGVDRIEDTFPHQLNRLLGADYGVNIVAQPGWDTNVQLAALDSYPVEPQIVILSHYYNDIGYALAENPVRVRFPEPPLDTIVDDYFLASFLYWHVFQFGTEGHGAEYVNLLLDAYHDPMTWGQHQTNLAGFVEWANAHNVRLIVIVFPALNNIAGSAAADARVVDYFESLGITVVDMGDALRSSDPAALIVNPFDAHPNPATHFVAAQLLYDEIAR